MGRINYADHVSPEHVIMREYIRGGSILPPYLLFSIYFHRSVAAGERETSQRDRNQTTHLEMLF